MEQNKSESHPFWSGYALGLISGGVILAAFTTKRGRKTVQKILEHSGDFEQSLDAILAYIQDDTSKPKDKKKKIVNSH